LSTSAITLANHYMAELCCRYDGTEMFYITDINRQYFTHQGIHLRTRGKVQLVRHLAKMSPKSHNSAPATEPLPTPRVTASNPKPGELKTLPYASHSEAVISAKKPL
ncbi:hypothetical protein J6590_019249, partial [Homalodisca vitripennis]